MKLIKLCGAACLTVAIVLMTITSGCFSNTDAADPSVTPTPTVVKPSPKVESVIATTSGTQDAYYATLNIKVKNEGAEGTILVRGSVTQGAVTEQSEMPVFLKHNESHELKLTFPLVWGGGDFTSDVITIVP
jgi:hypothetical protein